MIEFEECFGKIDEMKCEAETNKTFVAIWICRVSLLGGKKTVDSVDRKYLRNVLAVSLSGTACERIQFSRGTSKLKKGDETSRSIWSRTATATHV